VERSFEVCLKRRATLEASDAGVRWDVRWEVKRKEEKCEQRDRNTQDWQLEKIKKHLQDSKQDDLVMLRG